MGIGISLILIAVGAVLAFAVTATVQGLDIIVVGVILMIVGGFGLVLPRQSAFERGGSSPGRGRARHLIAARARLGRPPPTGEVQQRARVRSAISTCESAA